MNKAFLLDRDGTINVDTGYVMNANHVTLLPGVGEAISLMKKAGYLVIVVSNQSGVARGMGTEEDVNAVNQKINELLQPFEAHIDAFYYCPHHEDGVVEAYSYACDCRKPEVGLFQKAIDDFALEPKMCIAAGDKTRDVERLPELGIHRLGIIDKGLENGYESLLAFTKQMLKGEH